MRHIEILGLVLCLVGCDDATAALPDSAVVMMDASLQIDASVQHDASSTSDVLSAADVAFDIGADVTAVIAHDAAPTALSDAAADTSALTTTDAAPEASIDASVVALTLSSTAFMNGDAIPASPYACSPAGNYGTGTSPPLAWSSVPEGTLSFALLMDDASADDWTHWVLYDIPALTTSITMGVTPSGAIVGQDEVGFTSYSGPCPPTDTHTYSFRVYALDIATLALSAGATKAAVVAAMSGHVLASGELSGTVAADAL